MEASTEATINEEKETKESENVLNDEAKENQLETNLNGFLKWCEKSSMKLSSKVKVSHCGTSHRYGMIACENIKWGEMLFTVPRSLLLNEDNSSLVERLLNFENWLEDNNKSMDETSGWLPLLITLMWELRNPQSMWVPYLALIPQVEEFGHPLFWKTDEYVLEFKGMSLLNDITTDRENIELEYEEFVKPFFLRNEDLCGSAETYTLDYFKRMVAFVMAYSFTEEEQTPSMVPMADILNHSSENNAHLVFSTQHLKMIAVKPIAKGEEVFNTFGRLGNTELLQMYGYTEPSNKYDTLLIGVRDFYTEYAKQFTNGQKDNPALLAKVNLLNHTEIARIGSYFTFDRNGLRSGPDLIQFLKILFTSEEDFEIMLRKRAGNRSDSFYSKLLRCLRLSKKTDVSSGVAVIDITEDENEETAQEGDLKRKYIDVDEDGCSFAKHGREEEKVIVIEESSDEEEAVETVNHVPLDAVDNIQDESAVKEETEDKGESTSESIKKGTKVEQIDDKTADKSNQNIDNKPIACNTTSEASKNEADKQIETDIRLDNEIGKSEIENESQSKLTKEISENELSAEESSNTITTINNTHNNATTDNETNENKKQNNCEDNKKENITNNDTNNELNSNKTENGHSTDITQPPSDCCENIDDAKSSVQTPSMQNESAQIAKEMSDEDLDDIEITKEDIACALSYENIENTLDDDSKKFVLSILDCTAANLKDDSLGSSEDRSRNQRNAYHVRNGQREIIQVFRSALS